MLKEGFLFFLNEDEFAVLAETKRLPIRDISPGNYLLVDCYITDSFKLDRVAASVPTANIYNKITTALNTRPYHLESMSNEFKMDVNSITSLFEKEEIAAANYSKYLAALYFRCLYSITQNK